jgi:hypothetical protein
MHNATIVLSLAYCASLVLGVFSSPLLGLPIIGGVYHGGTLPDLVDANVALAGHRILTADVLQKRSFAIEGEEEKPESLRGTSTTRGRGGYQRGGRGRDGWITNVSLNTLFHPIFKLKCMLTTIKIHLLFVHNTHV